MSSVLVTGANGYIASHTILELINQGFTVRGTVRSLGSASSLNERLSKQAGSQISIDIVEADLSRCRGWDTAMRGMDYVIHLASPVALELPKDDELMIGPARDGALRVLEAAHGNRGVKRLLFASSATAITHGWGNRIPSPCTEEHWTDPGNLTDTTAYSRSKVIAERAAWSYVEEHAPSFELVSFNPTLVVGPVIGEKFSDTLSLVTSLMEGKVPLLPRVGYQIVDVRDVAKTLVQALMRPSISGRRFILSGDFLWMKDVASILRGAFPDRSFPRHTVPDALLHLAKPFDASIRQIAVELGRQRMASSAAAKRWLDWNPRPARETILDCAHSLVEHGVV